MFFDNLIFYFLWNNEEKWTMICRLTNELQCTSATTHKSHYIQKPDRLFEEEIHHLYMFTFLAENIPVAADMDQTDLLIIINQLV